MEGFLLQALTLAKNSCMSEQHAAVIWANAGPRRGEVLAMGYNKRFSFLPQQNYRKERHCSYHAELVALMQLPSRARGYIKSVRASMVVVRVKGNRLVLSKPCPGCTKKLENLGITVYYSTNHENVN